MKDAMRSRDPVAASALRTTLSTIANAEAVAVAPSAGPAAAAGHPHFAGAVAGLRAGEVARRHLSTTDVTAIVRAEIAERRRAAATYTDIGLSDQAERLRAEAAILTSVVAAAGLDS